MRLKKEQAEALLSWIADDATTGDINDRAEVFDPPFEVSRQQIKYYRRTRNKDIKELKESYENEALNVGLARKCVRVKKLQKLAKLLESDLFGSLLWLENKKGIGSGDIAEIWDYLEFNKAEVDAYRGVLDDIARELGGRVNKTEITGADGGDVKIKVSVVDD